MKKKTGLWNRKFHYELIMLPKSSTIYVRYMMHTFSIYTINVKQPTGKAHTAHNNHYI